MRHGSTTPARVIAAVGLALALAPSVASTSYAGVRQEGPIKVLGKLDNTFDPVDIEAAPDADGKITIEFTSEGFHTIQSDEVPGFDSDVVQNATKTITFDAPPAGSYKVICELHQPGMTATLIVGEGTGAQPTATATATVAPSSAPPASASASATVGAPEGGDNAPTAEPHGEEEGHGKDPFANIPGVKGNEVLERIDADRAAQAGAVSAFKFFTFVCVAFIAILGAAVLFSTRPRRAGR